MTRLAAVAMVLGVAIAIMGGWPGRRVTRDEAGCFTQELVALPHDLADRADPWRVLLPVPHHETHCTPRLVEVVRPACGPELRVLAASLALFAALAAAGYARLAVPLIATLGLAGAVIVFAVTRTLDSPTDATVYLWPRLAVRIGTGGLAVALVGLAIAWLTGTATQRRGRPGSPAAHPARTTSSSPTQARSTSRPAAR